MSEKFKEFLESNYPRRLLLKTADVAKMLDVGVSTVEQGRLTGRFPIRFLRIGRSIRYKLEDVERYLSTLKTYSSTSEADEDK